MSEPLHIDFETRSEIDLKKAGAEAYSLHPSTDFLCLAFSFDRNNQIQIIQRGEALPDSVREHVMSKNPVVAHNVAFERVIWNNICGPRYGWPELTIRQTYCTQAMAYAMGLPGSLEKCAQALGLSEEKDMKGQRLMLQLAKPRRREEDGSVVWWEDEDKFQRLYEYCKQDVRAQKEVYKKLLPLSDRERALWILDQKINERGVAVDMKPLRLAIDLIKREKEKLDRRMRKITGGAVSTCTSNIALTEWVNEEGVQTEGVSKSEVDKLLSQTNLPFYVREALVLRREAAKSSVAKLQSMLNSACPDGRIRGIFQFHGATTGRWAGRRIQPQNFPRGSLSDEQIDEVFRLIEASA